MNRFQTIQQGSNLSAVINQINKSFSVLDAEVLTKKFGSGANTVIIGRIGDRTGVQFGILSDDGIFDGQYAPGRFGRLYYQNGIPVSLDGQAPDDGRMGHWTVPAGVSVLAQLGG